MTTIDLLNVAEVQLHYSSKIKPSDRPRIFSSKDACEIFKNFWNNSTLELREEMKVLFLNRAHRVLGICTISSGGVAGTIADPKLIFAAALKANASAVMLCHNHPSGNLQPSQADIALTRKCKGVGELLDLQLLDHIIISPEEGYYSFADEGML